MCYIYKLYIYYIYIYLFYFVICLDKYWVIRGNLLIAELLFVP